MADPVELLEKPESKEIHMMVGWRQWADAGSVSSGLPEYLIQLTGARQIGQIRPDGFYIFQIPGTHDLVRPVVRFEDGYPEALDIQRNEFFYSGDAQRGMLYFLGDEPQMDVERYVGAVLDVAQSLGVKRIIGFGGVYGELPYDKERPISCNYSLKRMKNEMEALAVNLSDYEGGASIGSYFCRRAGDRGMEYTGLYAFVPTYDFSDVSEVGSAIRIETDYMAWLGVMRRVKYMLKLDLDLSDLEAKSEQLIQLMDEKVDEIEGATPQLGVRDYLQRLSEEYSAVTFDPVDEFWDDELRRLFDKFDGDE